jgi:hypothetical protein
MLVLARAWLPSYLSRLCAICQSAQARWGDTTPPQYSASKLGYGKELWTFIDTAIVETFQPKCRLGDAK